MNNKQFSNKKSTKMPIFAFILIIIGIFILAIFFKNMSILASKSKNYIETEAKVVNHTYRNGIATATVFQYTIGEDIYQTTSNDYHDNLKTYGTVIRIKYNPNDPTDIIFPDRRGNLIMPITGLVFFSVGIMIAIRFFIKISKNQNNKISIVQDAPMYNNILENSKSKKKKKKKRQETDNNSSMHYGINDVITNIDKNITTSTEQPIDNTYVNTTNTPIEPTAYNQAIETPNVNSYINTNPIIDNSFNNTNVAEETNYANNDINNYTDYTNYTNNIYYANSNNINNTTTNDIDIYSNHDMMNTYYEPPVTAEPQVIDEPKDIPEPLTEAQKIQNEIETMRNNNISEYSDVDDIPSFIPNIDEVNKRWQ